MTSLPVWSLAVLVLLAAESPRGAAQGGTSVEGQDTFREYCAACHGVSGKGDGPVAVILKKRPADLTTIKKRKRTFSAAEIEATITGTGTLQTAHGAPDMPVWGPYFTAVDSSAGVAKVRVTNLVKFIESIQIK